MDILDKHPIRSVQHITLSFDGMFLHYKVELSHCQFLMGRCIGMDSTSSFITLVYFILNNSFSRILVWWDFTQFWFSSGPIWIVSMFRKCTFFKTRNKALETVVA